MTNKLKLDSAKQCLEICSYFSIKTECRNSPLLFLNYWMPAYCRG